MSARPPRRSVLLTAALAMIAGIASAVPAAAVSASERVVDSAVAYSAPAHPRTHKGLLLNVSCPSRTFCVAVGTNTVWTLTGHRWTERRSAVNLGSYGDLSDVSCVSRDWCIAVGGVSKHGAATTNALAMLWNGRRWVRMRGVASQYTSVFGGVTCMSRTWCVAVGEHNRAYPKDSRARTYASVWNGARWREMKTPTGADNVQAELYDVACSKVGRCVAVGPTRAYDSGTSYLLTHGHWSIRTTKHVAGGQRLYAVSCLTSGVCTAVGDGGGERTSGTRPLVERWTGRSWRVMPAPAGKKDPGAQATGVSCLRASLCQVVGHTFSQDPATNLFEERWNGHRWAQQYLPARRAGEMEGVDCATHSFCVAVGYDVTGSNSTEWDTIYTYSSNKWHRVVS